MNAEIRRQEPQNQNPVVLFFLSAYFSVHLWAQAIQESGHTDVASIRRNLLGQSYDAPEGTVTVNGENHHIAKTALIGKVGADSLIHTEWSSGAPVEPDPFLKNYDWAKGLTG